MLRIEKYGLVVLFSVADASQSSQAQVIAEIKAISASLNARSSGYGDHDHGNHN